MFSFLGAQISTRYLPGQPVIFDPRFCCHTKLWLLFKPHIPIKQYSRESIRFAFENKSWQYLWFNLIIALSNKWFNGKKWSWNGVICKKVYTELSLQVLMSMIIDTKLFLTQFQEPELQIRTQKGSVNLAKWNSDQS